MKLIATHVVLALMALTTRDVLGQIVPSGGTLVGGSVSIGVPTALATGGVALAINQSSNRAVINWASFNIGALDQVNIAQPTANAALLNRVTGNQSSTIAGRLTSTYISPTGTVVGGQVYLVNPNGIAITTGAVINTGVFVASTLDINGPDQTTRNATFMSAGIVNPSTNSTEITFAGSGGSVSVQAGTTITTARGGYVALIGSTVSNDGIITVPAGTVALVSGENITLNFSLDGFLQIAKLNNPLTQAAGSDPLVSNTGTIKASGGLIQLSAYEAQNMARQIINLSGTVDTSGVSGQNGNIILTTSVSDTAIVARGASQPGSGSVIDATTLSNALAGANVTINSGTSGTQVGSIDVAPALSWSGNTKLALNAAADINLHGNLTAANGSLTLNAGGNITPAGAVSLGGVFELASGSWVQNASVLPGFYANDFRLSGGAFLRASGGDGSSGNPWVVNDLYGLQGIGSSAAYLAGNWTLAAQAGLTLDASGTANWNSGKGFQPLGQATAVDTTTAMPSVTGQGFSGSFNGGNNTLTGLVINRPTNGATGLFSINSGTIQGIGLTASTITGGDITGALVGYNSGTLSSVYNAGSVSGRNVVGGLVGVNEGTISTAYATGSVSGATSVGGLVGVQGTSSTTASPQLNDTYASGTVTGSSQLGGLIGRNLGNRSTISRSFWNISSSGLSTAIGVDDNNQSANTVGLTAAQTVDAFNYIDKGWDFSGTWGSLKSGGSPLLRSMTVAPVYDRYVKVSGNASSVYGDGITSTAGITIAGINATGVSAGWGSSIGTTTAAGTYGYGSANVLNLTYANGAASDYFVSYGTAALTVSRRPITVSADSLNGAYGTGLPNLTYTLAGTGLVNGDLLSGSLSTSATSRSFAGTYAITQGTLGSRNYDITFIPGTLTMSGTASPDVGSQASTIKTAFVTDQRKALPSTDSDYSAQTETSRLLIADPRFDSTEVCLASGGGCVSLAGQASP